MGKMRLSQIKWMEFCARMAILTGEKYEVLNHDGSGVPNFETTPDRCWCQAIAQAGCVKQSSLFTKSVHHVK